jgi:hypothetical protein
LSSCTSHRPSHLQDYAYWGVLPSFCNHLKANDRTVVDITGFEDVPANDEASLARAVAAQPVSIAVAVTPALQFYSSGVFDGQCGTALNHGVLLVGYGEEEEGGKFWKIKNSWGEGWGERCAPQHGVVLMSPIFHAHCRVQMPVAPQCCSSCIWLRTVQSNCALDGLLLANRA